MKLLNDFKEYSNKHPLIFTLLFLFGFVFASSACTLRPEQQSYHFEVNSCSTGKHEFCSKDDLCKGLQSDSLNNYCAREIRRTHFNSNCYGQYFQEWGSLPSSAARECPSRNYSGNATITYEQTAPEQDTFLPLTRECTVAIHNAALISPFKLETHWKNQKAIGQSELLKQVIRITFNKNSSFEKQPYIHHIFQHDDIIISTYLTFEYDKIKILSYHRPQSQTDETQISLNSEINLTGYSFTIKSSPHSHLVFDCSLK